MAAQSAGAQEMVTADFFDIAILRQTADNIGHHA
jgi:hypothetical protein